MPDASDAEASRWPAWADADQSIRAAWERGYPNEKLVALEANGAPDSYEKEKPTGETGIDEYGNHIAYFEKITFARIPAKALVQAGAGQRRYSLAAIFRIHPQGFVFEDMSVGGSTEVAQAGQPELSKELAKQLIAAHWEAENPGSKVEEIKCSDPELKRQASKGRWWFSTGADIYVVEGGAKRRYSNDMTNLYKGEKGKEGVDASGDWKVYFLDKPLLKK